MDFLSQNSHISPERFRPDVLPGVVRANCTVELVATALRIEWHLLNGCIDAAQLPAFREFLNQLGPS